MALVFKHHTRYAKRLYNGLKKIDDITVPKISHSDEVDGGNIASVFNAIRKLVPIAEYTMPGVSDSDSEDTGIIEKCDVSHHSRDNEDILESDESNEDASESVEAISVDSKAHVPSRLPPTEKKKWPQKPCVVCRKYGDRHDTRYFCAMCNKALCKSPCFKEYHSM